MKDFSEFRKNLTSKQVHTYSLIISLILSLIADILFTIFIWSFHEVQAILIGALISMIIFLISYLILTNLIFRIDEKNYNENQEAAKQRVIAKYKLDTNSNVHVHYNFSFMLYGVPDKEMIVELLKMPEYEFYLRLTKNDEVMITVTNKNNYVVYVDTVTDFIYVETYFENID